MWGDMLETFLAQMIQAFHVNSVHSCL